MPNPGLPAPSPALFRELLISLPATFRQAVKEQAGYQCLDRELQQFEQAIAAVDQVEAASASTTSLVLVEARRRERRAFRRTAIVAAALVNRPAPTPESIGLSLLILVAAAQGTREAVFPWAELRQVIAAIAEL